jgi:NitT/TauT family transport system substrate-binding protein
LFLSVFLFAVAIGGARAAETVDFLIDWKGDPTYAGVYVAKELGYFRDQGVDVSITEGTGGAVAAEIVGTGAAHWIGTASGSATAIAISHGIGIRSLAVLYPNIPTVMYSRSDNPVGAPKDLPGKKVGLVDGSVTVNEFRALLSANGIDRKRVTEVPVANDPKPLLDGEVDALLDYGELLPTALRSHGHAITSFRLSEFGVKMYGLNIIVNDARWRDAASRAEAEKVSRAIVRGYQFLKDHPEQAANIYLRIFPGSDPAYVRQAITMVTQELGAGEIGAQSADGWRGTTRTLKSLGLISHVPRVDDLIAR